LKKEATEAFGEEKSLSNVLKELTNSYVVCKECFDQGNYPKVFSSNDFEAQTIESILDEPASKEGDAQVKYLSAEDR
jgi:hypothetical protein